MGLNWGLYGVPETFVIDSDGTVVLRHAGPITRDILETEIRPAIARATGG
jgi:cytochrome c biogenesis protein CcmG/thiol:disulfide interchange protein DsbE